MTSEEKRQQVIDACIAHHQHIADVAKQEMDSAQQQSNDYGANVDRYDAYRTKLMRQRDMYAKQYSNALAAIRVLGDLKRQAITATVQHGSIVITPAMSFFLSIGAGKFMVGDKAFYAVSAQTPIYLALKGKEVGDSVIINGKGIAIQEIY